MGDRPKRMRQIYSYPCGACIRGSNFEGSADCGKCGEQVPHGKLTERRPDTPEARAEERASRWGVMEGD